MVELKDNNADSDSGTETDASNKNDFVEKAKHKGQVPEQFLTTWNRKSKQFEQLWKHYLAHQIANLPEFEGVSRALNRHFKLL